MLEELISSTILSLLAIWLMKSIVDLIRYLQVKNQHKCNRDIGLDYSRGIEVDIKIGESNDTKRPII